MPTVTLRYRLPDEQDEFDAARQEQLAPYESLACRREPPGVTQPAGYRVIATLRFDLSDPDDERQHRYALAGRDALIALEKIDQHCRSRIKYGEPCADEVHALEAVRALVPHELTSLLE
jgi:hypothetical protein